VNRCSVQFCIPHVKCLDFDSAVILSPSTAFADEIAAIWEVKEFKDIWKMLNAWRLHNEITVRNVSFWSRDTRFQRRRLGQKQHFNFLQQLYENISTQKDWTLHIEVLGCFEILVVKTGSLRHLLVYFIIFEVYFITLNIAYWTAAPCYFADPMSKVYISIMQSFWAEVQRLQKNLQRSEQQNNLKKYEKCWICCVYTIKSAYETLVFEVVIRVFSAGHCFKNNILIFSQNDTKKMRQSKIERFT